MEEVKIFFASDVHGSEMVKTIQNRGYYPYVNDPDEGVEISQNQKKSDSLFLGLFGHIHEGKGARIYKKTLCINPGSMYEQGILNGGVIELRPKKIKTYILTTG
ncbi:MAG: hypothetical protein AMS17_13115 [Spirochaetes bacterium DG_61]|nr:MAG: hypothetical protein AMS17_13115 [Spirochaetes bacterium DG_61]